MLINHLNPPIPDGLPDDLLHDVANRLHSLAIHLLRNARAADRAAHLTPERLSLLSVLAYSGPRTISELAAIEAVSLPAITRIVNYLEGLELVERDRTSDDGRVVRVLATEKGRQLMEEGRRRRVEIIADELAELRQLELMAVANATSVLEHAEEARAHTPRGAQI